MGHKTTNNAPKDKAAVSMASFLQERFARIPLVMKQRRKCLLFWTAFLPVHL